MMRIHTLESTNAGVLDVEDVIGAAEGVRLSAEVQ